MHTHLDFVYIAQLCGKLSVCRILRLFLTFNHSLPILPPYLNLLLLSYPYCSPATTLHIPQMAREAMCWPQWSITSVKTCCCISSFCHPSCQNQSNLPSFVDVGICWWCAGAKPGICASNRISKIWVHFSMWLMIRYSCAPLSTCEVSCKQYRDSGRPYA